MNITLTVPESALPSTLESSAPQAQALRDGLAAQRTLMQLVLDGAGLPAIARALSSNLRRSVVIEDKQFNLLGFGQANDGAEAFASELLANKGTPVSAIKRWEEDGTLALLRKDRTPAVATGESVPRTIQPLVAGERVVGFLSIVGDNIFDERDRLVVEQGLVACTVELLKQSGAAENEAKQRQDFFRDLLIAHTPEMAETLRRRASYLGLAPTASYWVLSVEFDEVKQEDALADNLARLEGILNSLLSFRQAIVIPQLRGATVLYPVKDAQPSQDKVHQLGAAIQQKAGGAGLFSSLSIGVGQLPGELMGLPRAHVEAQHALKIGRSSNGSGRVTFFAELGIYRMLLQFSQTQDPNEFFCEPLQRLIEYNQQTDKELVKTLAAFLECNGNLTETSEKLFIHRNTLKYRLERIRDITQIDIDDSQNRLMLHLGLKMNQVLRFLA